MPSGTAPGQYHVAADLLVNGDDDHNDNVAWSFNKVTITAGPPANDQRSSPAAIDSHGGTYPGTTLGATPSNPPIGSCGASGTTADVWYTMVPATAGQLVLETCGSSYDTVIESSTTRG